MREFSRDASERGQVLIAEAITALANGNEPQEYEASDFSGFSKDATEYGQWLILNAIRSLSNNSNANTDSSKIVVNIEQREHQTMSYNISGGHDSYFRPSGTFTQNNDGFTSGCTLELLFEVDLKFSTDSGYVHGDPVITVNGTELTEGDTYGDYSWWDGDNVRFYVPLGSTVNISSTPLSAMS